MLSCATRSASLLSGSTKSRFLSSRISDSGSVGLWRSLPRPRLSTAIANAAASTSRTPSPSKDGREHPTFPRVGVATVLFKPRTSAEEEVGSEEPLLLLVQRAKPPNEGLWSFPGGALELGEAVVAGAERELSEEVPGLEFERDASVAGELAGGVAFAAADSIHYDSEDEEEEAAEEGKGKEGSSADGEADERRRGKRATPRSESPRFHWAIIEVAAVAKASSPGPLVFSSPPETADDASASRWVGALSELRLLEERGRATRGCARVAAEAVRRFGRDLGYRGVL